MESVKEKVEGGKGKGEGGRNKVSMCRSIGVSVKIFFYGFVIARSVAASAGEVAISKAFYDRLPSRAVFLPRSHPSTSSGQAEGTEKIKICGHNQIS